MDEAESPRVKVREITLHDALTETIQRLEADRRCRDAAARGRGVGKHGGNEEEMLEPAEEEEEEEEFKQKVLAVSRELSVFHSDRVAAWREGLRKCADMFSTTCPPEGSDQQYPSAAECQTTPQSDSFTDTLLRVCEDIQKIMEKLKEIQTDLDEEISKFSARKLSTPVGPHLQDGTDPKASEQTVDDDHLNSHDSQHEYDTENRDAQSPAVMSPDLPQRSESRTSSNNVEEEGKDLMVKSQEVDNECASPDDDADFTLETNENDKCKAEMNDEWITVGLSGLKDDLSGVQDVCFIRTPTGGAVGLSCEVANTLSCMMVTDTEELVSKVIRIELQDGVRFRFPLTVVVPFCARYRGNYRDIAVKIVDGEKRMSYVTPMTTEGPYGGQRGSFAEVRVYSLGLFAVVSCLKRENYTVPTKGLSFKLPMDPRICLNYLPGSFTGPVMVQTRIQPVDAVLLSAVKSRSDVHHSVVSTSPLLYLSHPTSQPLRRPLSLTLPCPPNPEKRRRTRRQGEVEDHQAQTVEATSHSRRFLGASVKRPETSDELLIALGSRDKQWSVLEKVTVRNQQNGLVSFELTESFDRLLVVRLLSPLLPCHLTSLAEELEESLCCHSVTVVLRQRRDEPHVVLVAVLPSRELSWETSKLRAQGYDGLQESSTDICMREGDQLLLRFSGNITSTGTPNDQNDVAQERVTFHNQRSNQLLLHLTEVDPFGNHSSPHYKGSAVFYKVTRGQLEWSGGPVDTKLLGEPVCRLPLTLPKRVRSITRPIVTRVKLCEETDSLSDSLLLWLSGELSEEEVALLVLALRLRRSAAQLVKLRAGDSLSTQAYNVLSMWRRGLPAVPKQHKVSQLAHCLARSGRPDLARELLLRQAAATGQKQGTLKSWSHTDI